MNVILHLSDLFFYPVFCWSWIWTEGQKLLDWCTDVNTTLKRTWYRLSEEELSLHVLKVMQGY